LFLHWEQVMMVPVVMALTSLSCMDKGPWQVKQHCLAYTPCAMHNSRALLMMVLAQPVVMGATKGRAFSAGTCSRCKASCLVCVMHERKGWWSGEQESCWNRTKS
jgi:hypothetical protein